MAKSPSPFDPTIIDAASLYDASEAIAERFDRKITLDYSKLRVCLDASREARGWRRASLNTILLSVDPNSEGQQRFQAMLRHSGFELDVLHYRDTFVSLPPGRSPSDKTGKPTVSLAPRIAYMAGLIARHSEPQLLVVSHSFELYGPLSDLAHRVRNGRVGVAYFASLLDYRWKAAGVLDSNRDTAGGVEFFDLDPSGSDLTGVDLAGTPSGSKEPRGVLSRF
jgi:hypothetical protein